MTCCIRDGSKLQSPIILRDDVRHQQEITKRALAYVTKPVSCDELHCCIEESPHLFLRN